MPSFDTLQIASPHEHIAVVTLNRPDRANALNATMAQDIETFWSQAGASGDLRCIVLTGSGTRAFCAGADLKDRLGMTPEAWHRQHACFERAIQAINGSTLPTIAAVNGAAFGGGLELILACDFAYGVPDARFAFSEVSLGIMAGLGGTYRFPQVVGVPRAKELMLTGTHFDAEQARAWGLLNDVYDAGDLLEGTLDKARHLARNAPLAVQATRRAIDLAAAMDYETWTTHEHRLYYRLIPTRDREEGINAFNDRRAPHFEGR